MKNLNVNKYGQWALDGKWGYLLHNMKTLYTQKSINSFNGSSFHEWLLTNPDKMAFEVWKQIRNKRKIDGSYVLDDYADSAALVLYANLTERLEFLDEDEWGGCINYTTLKDKGIALKFNDSIPNEIHAHIAKKMDEDIHISAFDLAHMSEYLKLPGKNSSENMVKGEKEWVSRIGHYLMNKNRLPIDMMINVVKKRGSVAEYLLFEGVIKASDNVQKISEVWGKLSVYGINYILGDFKSSIGVDDSMRSKVFQKYGLNIIKFFDSVLNSNEKKPFTYSIDDLWLSVESGKLDLAKFLLDKNPYLLEKEMTLFKNGLDDYKSTVLSLAVSKSNHKMTKLLLSYGASLEPLERLLQSEKAWEYEEKMRQTFIINAEKTILESRIQNKTTKSAILNDAL